MNIKKVKWDEQHICKQNHFDNIYEKETETKNHCPDVC